MVLGHDEPSEAAKSKAKDKRRSDRERGHGKRSDKHKDTRSRHDPRSPPENEDYQTAAYSPPGSYTESWTDPSHLRQNSTESAHSHDYGYTWCNDPFCDDYANSGAGEHQSSGYSAQPTGDFEDTGIDQGQGRNQQGQEYGPETYQTVDGKRTTKSRGKEPLHATQSPEEDAGEVAGGGHDHGEVRSETAHKSTNPSKHRGTREKSRHHTRRENATEEQADENDWAGYGYQDDHEDWGGEVAGPSTYRKHPQNTETEDAPELDQADETGYELARAAGNLSLQDPEGYSDEEVDKDGDGGADEKWVIKLRILTPISSRWERAIGFLDTGNSFGPMILLKKVLDMGYRVRDLDIENVLRFNTMGGPQLTYGSIHLTYRDKSSTTITEEFHAIDFDWWKYDIWFGPPERIAQRIEAGEEATVFATTISADPVSDEEREQQYQLAKAQEAKALKAAADEKDRRDKKKKKGKSRDKKSGWKY